MGFSIWSGTGNLGRDAELKSVNGQPVCEFSLAVNNRNGDATWFRCTVWGERGAKLAEHLVKGKTLSVSGELQPREYKGKNDELRTSLDVRVNTLEFVGGGKAEQPKSAPSKAGYEDETPF